MRNPIRVVVKETLLAPVNIIKGAGDALNSILDDVTEDKCAVCGRVAKKSRGCYHTPAERRDG